MKTKTVQGKSVVVPKPPSKLKRWLTPNNLIIIVAILFVAGVFYYFNTDMNIDRPIPDSCTFAEGLQCEEFHVTPEGIELVMKNSGQSTIEVTDFRVKESSPVQTLMECEFDSFSLAPSETRAIQASLCPTPLSTISLVGNKLKFYITYEYSLGDDSAKHTGTGVMVAKVR